MRITVISDNPTLATFVINEIVSLGKHQIKLKFTADGPRSHLLRAMGGELVHFDRPEEVNSLIKENDLILSVHCKKIFPDHLIESVRCINIHPGYNPVNRGWYPQVFSIYNQQIAGATIHLMTKDIDAGPIIVQGEVPILFHENSKDVYEKIVALEKQLFRDNLPLILNMNTDGWKPPFGNYNDREDFREMCELDLQSTDTLENHIRLLRSLTFPGYRNAYAQINGHKYFIEISVTPENLEK